jgi:hypothetical protein
VGGAASTQPAYPYGRVKNPTYAAHFLNACTPVGVSQTLCRRVPDEAVPGLFKYGCCLSPGLPTQIPAGQTHPAVPAVLPHPAPFPSTARCVRRRAAPTWGNAGAAGTATPPPPPSCSWATPAHAAAASAPSKHPGRCRIHGGSGCMRGGFKGGWGGVLFWGHFLTTNHPSLPQPHPLIPPPHALPPTTPHHQTSPLIIPLSRPSPPTPPQTSCHHARHAAPRHPLTPTNRTTCPVPWRTGAWTTWC